MAASLDPVREGLVRSLARPGGNVTGMTIISDAELIGKRLQVAREVIPGAARVGLVMGPRTAAFEAWERDGQAAARSIGLVARVFDLRDVSHSGQVFAEAVRERADFLYFVEFAGFVSRRREIAENALRLRIPTVFGNRVHAEAGGLLSYGADRADVARRAADFVDRILKGARPGDLPVEQATKFELVVNLKTASKLGLTIPPSVLALGPELIE